MKSTVKTFDEIVGDFEQAEYNADPLSTFSHLTERERLLLLCFLSYLQGEGFIQ